MFEALLRLTFAEDPMAIQALAVRYPTTPLLNTFTRA
jgi:hypothetical protein